MPATRPPYHPEFRAQAVQLVKDSGNSMRQIAADLGVCYETLRKWTRQVTPENEAELFQDDNSEGPVLRRDTNCGRLGSLSV